MPMFRNAVPPTVPVGSNPVSTATADVNGDGHLDLLVTNYIGDSVSVLLGDGDGGFTPVPVPVMVGNGPREVEAADLDGDGDIDFIVANYSGNSVSVLINNGAGAFTPLAPALVGTVPRHLALGDLDGDGDLDFVSVNYGADTLSVMLASGFGPVQAAGSPVPLGSDPVGVAMGDFDGDSDLDVAVTSLDDENVSILLNNGSAGFTAAAGSPVALGIGTAPRDIAPGDLDGDGDLDLAVANFGNQGVAILLNNGSAGFAPAAGSPLTTQNNPYDIAIGDLDGDGDLDLAVANSGSSSVTIFRNNGSGTFATGVTFAVGVSPGSISMGDYDEDGDLDLAVSNFSSNTVSVLINTMALYSVTSNLATVNEGTLPGVGGELVFIISRNATSEAEDVTYTLSGSAIAGIDFTGASGTVSFAVGQATAEIHILIAADAVAELDESVTLTLAEASGDGDINPAAASATGTILNDDFVFIVGTKKNDVIDATQTPEGQPLPSAFDDAISGLGGNDKLFGNDGDDRLIGGKGKDKMTGEAGADTFVFDASLKQPADKILDFSVLDDTVELSLAIFKKLALGALSDTGFRDIGEKATNETRITYKSNGELSYDKDGKGGADAVVFAKLTTKPDIDASDFLVVG